METVPNAVAKDPDAEGGADNNPEAGEATGPAERSSLRSDLRGFHLLAREMAKLYEPDLFPDEGVDVSELTPEDLMKATKEVVDR